MNWRVPLADLDFGEEEQDAVFEVLGNQWLSMGVVTEEFENRFADMVGVKHAIAVSNAFSASCSIWPR